MQAAFRRASVLLSFLVPALACREPPTFTPPPPSISITLARDSLQVGQGATGTLELALQRRHHEGYVTLSASGAPDGVTVVFGPSILSGSALSSAVTVHVEQRVPAGSHQLTVRAVSSPVGATAAFRLVVISLGTFHLRWVPDTLFVPQGAVRQLTLHADRTGTFTAPIQLEVIYPPGLGGLAVVFDNSLGTGVTSVGASVYVHSSIPVGSYDVAVKGTSPGQPARTASFVLVVLPPP